MAIDEIKRRWLRRPEAALYCGVSVQFLEKAAARGDGPKFSRISRRLVTYDVLDLDAWLAGFKRP